MSSNHKPKNRRNHNTDTNNDTPPNHSPPPRAKQRRRSSYWPTNVYVRIRPEADSGGHASSSSITTPPKSLDGWWDNSVTLRTQYLFSKGHAEYTFPTKVLGPDASQSHTFETLQISSLVDQCIGCDKDNNDNPHKFQGGRNVMLFAYGQTGSGKTHTMLGTDESLRFTHTLRQEDDHHHHRPESSQFHPGWGIFPRVYVTALAKLKQQQVQQQQQQHYSFMLSASAIQFYLGETQDLLDPSSSSPVKIDPETHEVVGATKWDLHSTHDLLHYLNTVRTNRQTRATKMNEGSSRSHAALILYVRQYYEYYENVNHNNDTDNGDTTTSSSDGKVLPGGWYCQTTFTIMDLAGAERPTKTGETRFTSAEMILWEMSRDITTEVPTGAQAYIVNWELSGLATEITKATEYHHRRRRRPRRPESTTTPQDEPTTNNNNHKNIPPPPKYTPPKQLATDAIRFLSACLSGKAITSLCLCLSPANVNGWETWFSLQWGQSVSKLHIPVDTQYPVHFEKAYAQAKKEALQSKVELEKSQETQQQQHHKMRRTNYNKYHEARKFRFQIATTKMQDFEKMAQVFSSSSLAKHNNGSM